MKAPRTASEEPADRHGYFKTVRASPSRGSGFATYFASIYPSDWRADRRV